LLLSLLLLISPRPAHATWIVWDTATVWQVTVEQMLKQIEQSVVANLKIQAIRFMNARLMALLGGKGGGGPQVVTNWRQTIYGSAHQEANKTVKDYFSSRLAGTGPGGRRIVAAGQKIFYTDPATVSPTIDKYIREGRVDKIFDKNYAPNTAQALNDLSKMRNYPIFYSETAGGLYALNYGEKAGSEAAKNIAYGGFKGTGDTSGKKGKDAGGEENITMPGSAKRDIFAKTKGSPIEMIANARSVPEVATALVSQMLNQMINQGFNMVGKQIDSQINQFRRQFGASVPGMQNMIQKGWR